ncbi:hypothetical protein ACFXTN_039870 [Malus domestica]
MYEELVENSQQFNTRGRQAKRSAYAISGNNGLQVEMPSMNKNIEALIKTLSPQSSQQALKSNIKSKSILLDKKGILRSTIRTQIYIIRDGGITLISIMQISGMY